MAAPARWRATLSRNHKGAASIEGQRRGKPLRRSLRFTCQELVLQLPSTYRERLAFLNVLDLAADIGLVAVGFATANICIGLLIWGRYSPRAFGRIAASMCFDSIAG
jgi:hypothetical protein